jgi:hypothetical protein
MKEHTMMMMKLGLGPVALGALLFTAPLASGCSLEASSRTTTRREPAAGTPTPAPALPVRPGEVIDPRQGVAFDVTDYAATESPYRLFGIEPGDEQTPRSAIIAQTRGWSTRAYREGDALGRGLRVERIDPAGVTLHSASGEIFLAIATTTPLRVVRHRLDVVAQPLGKHRFALDTAAARAALPALPSHERHELYGAPVVKLGPVTPGTLLAEADFREGDLVAGVDGAPASDDTVPEIARALTDGRPSFAIRVYRGGVPLERLFVTAASTR